MALISIIIPVYNSADTLERCVQSYTSQDVRDIEILLINDGSTDNSREVCETLAQNDSRIKLFDIPHSGPATARNVGIDNAVGDFLTFCDADDYVTRGSLSYMYSKIAHYDILCCGLIFDYEGKTPRLVAPACKQLTAQSLKGLKDRNLLDTMCNKLYRTEFVKNSGVRLPDGELYEDTAFNQQLLQQKPKVVFSRRCLYHYMQKKGESITRRYNPQKLELMKARGVQLRALEEDLGGDGRIAAMFYIRTLLSCFTDFFIKECPLKRNRIKAIIRTEKDSDLWKNSLKVAFADGFSDKIMLFAASGSVGRIYRFCRLAYIFKYKTRKLFFALR